MEGEVIAYDDDERIVDGSDSSLSCDDDASGLGLLTFLTSDVSLGSLVFPLLGNGFLPHRMSAFQCLYKFSSTKPNLSPAPLDLLSPFLVFLGPNGLRPVLLATVLILYVTPFPLLSSLCSCSSTFASPLAHALALCTSTTRTYRRRPVSSLGIRVIIVIRILDIVCTRGWTVSFSTYIHRPVIASNDALNS